MRVSLNRIFYLSVFQHCHLIGHFNESCVTSTQSVYFFWCFRPLESPLPPGCGGERTSPGSASYVREGPEYPHLGGGNMPWSALRMCPGGERKPFFPSILFSPFSDKETETETCQLLTSGLTALSVRAGIGTQLSGSTALWLHSCLDQHGALLQGVWCLHYRLGNGGWEWVFHTGRIPWTFRIKSEDSNTVYTIPSREWWAPLQTHLRKLRTQNFRSYKVTNISKMVIFLFPNGFTMWSPNYSSFFFQWIRLQDIPPRSPRAHLLLRASLRCNRGKLGLLPF